MHHGTTDTATHERLRPRTRRQRPGAIILTATIVAALLALIPRSEASDDISIRLTDDRTAVVAQLEEMTTVHRIELWRLEPRGERRLEWAVARPSGAALDRIVIGQAPGGFVTVQPGAVPLDAFELELLIVTGDGERSTTFALPHVPGPGGHAR